MAKYGTYTRGLTPEAVIRAAFTDEETGGFSWDLQGEDSRNANALGLFSHNETTEAGFIAIVTALDEAGDGDGTDDQLADWAMMMRSDMLGCIGIEEI